MNSIRPLLLVFIAAVLVFPVPGLAASETDAQIRAEIASLLKRIADLESRLSAGSNDSSTTLEIENLQITVSGDSANITWSTTMPAESRLMLDNGDGRVYESKFGIKHKVKVADLEPSKDYEFKITARSKDKKSFDDFYDNFSASKKYTASFVRMDGKCAVIRIEDTAGKTAKKLDLAISGIFSTQKGNTARGTAKMRTDSNGEFEYCKPVTTLTIKGGKGVDLSMKVSIPEQSESGKAESDTTFKLPRFYY